VPVWVLAGVAGGVAVLVSSAGLVQTRMPGSGYG
jgi:hypothetical protein